MDYVSAAISQLRVWRKCPSELMDKSLGAIENYRNMHNTSSEALKNIFTIISAA
jgi:hypothetical protein